MKNLIATIQGLGRSREFQNWTLFCFFIFLLQILLFAIDPIPKFLMGDSGSYIWTALTGWIPDSRSYFYGYVIRWTSVWSQSLTSLLVLQLCLGTIVCILVALICHFIFKLTFRWSCLFGFFCAIDPLQLLWERYVMTETISLCAYAFVLHHSFLYLRDRRLRYLVIMQAVSIVLIGFRMSFLVLIQINAVILPLIAFAPDILKRTGHQPIGIKGHLSTVRVCLGHLLISLALMFVLHTGYKRANGWVANREPAYLWSSGLIALAVWSPVVQPQDAPDPRLAELIAGGDEFAIHDPDQPTSQLFAPGFLIDRWSKIEPDPAKADFLARRTALRALRRDPGGILKLAFRTYALQWDVANIKKFAEADFSFANPPSDDLLSLLAERFHLAQQKGASTPSFLQNYYAAAWPYYFLVLLAPLLGAIAIALRSARRHAVLLFVHSSVLISFTTTFGGPSVRYLQPISLMTVLIFALWVSALRGAVSADRATAEMTRRPAQ